MNVTDYIREISLCSNRYGDKLIELMERCNVTNLASVTLEQAKDFYERRCKVSVATGQRRTPTV